MKLQNKSLAGAKLALAGGVTLTVDADGCVTSEDKKVQDQLLVVGFKKPFSKTAPTTELSATVPAPAPAPVADAPEPEDFTAPQANSETEESEEPAPTPETKHMTKAERKAAAKAARGNR